MIPRILSLFLLTIVGGCSHHVASTDTADPATFSPQLLPTLSPPPWSSWHDASSSIAYLDWDQLSLPPRIDGIPRRLPQLVAARGWGRSRPAHARAAADVPPSRGTAGAQLGAIRLTATGTITLTAMQAMVRECIRLQGRVTTECDSAVQAGEGGFRSAPQDARREFSFLLRGCAGAQPDDDCMRIIARDREFRDLPRGRLVPSPLTMQEGERVLFTARVVQDSRIQGRPGRVIEESESGPSEGSIEPNPGQSVIPFSHRMCFNLAAINPGDFLIEPPNRHCLNIRGGGGAVKFDPQWYVTPLRSGRVGLLLVTELYVGGEKRHFRHEPYPLPITVTPKPSLWDRIDNTIRRITATVNLAVGLAEALGALFTAIAAWAIWAWLRRRRKRARSTR
jgi:hypothetical protein